MFRKLQKNHYPVDSAIRLLYNRPLVDEHLANAHDIYAIIISKRNVCARIKRKFLEYSTLGIFV